MKSNGDAYIADMNVISTASKSHRKDQPEWVVDAWTAAI